MQRHYTAGKGSLDGIRWLVERVAGQPEHQAPWSPTSNYKAAIDYCSSQCSTSYSDNMNGVILLSKDCTMPVLYAALTVGQVPAAELLLEMGSDVNDIVYDDCESTALHLVPCHRGYLKDAIMLLQHGADVHAKVWVCCIKCMCMDV
jgi:hypothetical protein